MIPAFLSCVPGFNVETLPAYAKRSQRMVITARMWGTCPGVQGAGNNLEFLSAASQRAPHELFVGQSQEFGAPVVTPLEVKGPRSLRRPPQGGFVCRTEGSREPFPLWDANPKVVGCAPCLGWGQGWAHSFGGTLGRRILVFSLIPVCSHCSSGDKPARDPQSPDSWAEQASSTPHSWTFPRVPRSSHLHQDTSE